MPLRGPCRSRAAVSFLDWEEATAFGAVIGGLIGSTSAIALVEHVWAKPLKAAIARAGGMEVENDWLRLDELVAIGLRSSLQLGDIDSEGEERHE
jgi:hypothetical protein